MGEPAGNFAVGPTARGLPRDIVTRNSDARYAMTLGGPAAIAHVVTAAYLTTSFVVLAVGARYLLGGRHLEHGRTMVRMAVCFAAIAAPLQLFIGDQHGLNTLEHQPLKIAAMEAHWDGNRPGELVLFAWPDESAETNRFAVTIPHGASLVLTHRWDGLFAGLTSVPSRDRPPVVPPFFAFRTMVGIGMVMILAGLSGVWLWWRGRLLRVAVVPMAGAACLVDGFRRGDLRLDRYRDRAAALGRLRHPENSRRDFAGSDGQSGYITRVVRAGLRHRVCDGNLLHQQADHARTGRSCEQVALGRFRRDGAIIRIAANSSSEAASWNRIYR